MWWRWSCRGRGLIEVGMGDVEWWSAACKRYGRGLGSITTERVCCARPGRTLQGGAVSWKPNKAWPRQKHEKRSKAVWRTGHPSSTCPSLPRPSPSKTTAKRQKKKFSHAKAPLTLPGLILRDSHRRALGAFFATQGQRTGERARKQGPAPSRPPTPPIIRHSFRYPTLAPTAASVAGTTRESVRACADHKRRQAPGSSPTRDPALLHSLGHRNKTSSSPHASHALLSIEQKQRLLKKKKLFMQGFDPWTLRVF